MRNPWDTKKGREARRIARLGWRAYAGEYRDDARAWLNSRKWIVIPDVLQGGWAIEQYTYPKPKVAPGATVTVVNERAWRVVAMNIKSYDAALIEAVLMAKEAK